MSIWTDLDAGMAEIAEQMFGTAVITRKTDGSYDPRTDRRTAATTATLSVGAIRASETITDDQGVTKTETVAYTRDAIQVGDTLTMGATTNVVRSVDPLSPTDVVLMYRAVLS